MLKPRFVPLVLADAKLQTCRPIRKRMPQPEEIADLRSWKGVPYRSSKDKLGDRSIERIASIRVLLDDGAAFINDIHLTRDELELFAVADGFAEAGEFLEFFRNEYKKSKNREWRGFVTFWRPQDPGKFNPFLKETGERFFKGPDSLMKSRRYAVASLPKINGAKLHRENRVYIHPITDLGGDSYLCNEGWKLAGWNFAPTKGAESHAIVYERVKDTDDDTDNRMFQIGGIYWGHGNATKMHFYDSLPPEMRDTRYRG